MTTPEMIRSRRPSRVLASVAVGVTTLAATVMSAPAHADVPEGWSNPAQVDNLEALLRLAGIPLLLFILIVLAVYIPSMVRGERLLPDHSGGDAQWLGGPASGKAELPAPDDEKSRAGGASGNW